MLSDPLYCWVVLCYPSHFTAEWCYAIRPTLLLTGSILSVPLYCWVVVYCPSNVTLLSGVLLTAPLYNNNCSFSICPIWHCPVELCNPSHCTVHLKFILFVTRPTLHILWKYTLSVTVPLQTVHRSYVKLSTCVILSDQLSWSLELCYPSHCSSSEKMFCHLTLVTLMLITDTMLSVPMQCSYFSSTPPTLHSFYIHFFSFSFLL